MKNTKHFATCNGQTVIVQSVGYRGVEELAVRGLSVEILPAKVEITRFAWGGGIPTVYGYMVGKCECGAYHFVERRIERPDQASNHKCDGRCMNSKGRRCECSCGGKNHGAN